MQAYNKFPVPAFSIKNENKTFPCLIVCEHASNYIPPFYNQLGLDDHLLTEHIAWDFGAKELSDYLAESFGCTAVFCQYSRLLIDCNRFPEENSSILEISEHHVVPGNQEICQQEKQHRLDNIFFPFHHSVTQQIERLMDYHSDFPLIGVHSFTPSYNNESRHWKFSVMWKYDTPFVRAIIKYFESHPLKDVIGFNEPYSAKELSAYTTEYHGDSNQLPNLIFEVRQDLLQDEAGIKYWGTIIEKALCEVIVN